MKVRNIYQSDEVELGNVGIGQAAIYRGARVINCDKNYSVHFRIFAFNGLESLESLACLGDPTRNCGFGMDSTSYNGDKGDSTAG